MPRKPDLPAFDFRSGSDQTVTGACHECRNGRHLACRSLERNQETEAWPHFSDESDGWHDPSAAPGGSGWECECLAQSTRRKDHAKHEGVLE